MSFYIYAVVRKRNQEWVPERKGLYDVRAYDNPTSAYKSMQGLSKNDPNLKVMRFRADDAWKYEPKSK